MKNVGYNLYIGKVSEIPQILPVIVNLSSKAHYTLHSWERGDDIKNHLCYVSCTHLENLLSVNWVDADAKYFKVETVKQILAFIKKHVQEGKVYVVCDQGNSRSGAMAITYLAKENMINNGSFKEALLNFQHAFPDIKPSKGISKFLEENWSKI